MKKILSMVIAVVLVMSMAGCSKKSTNKTVELTIPALMIQGQSEEQIKKDAEDKGFISAKLNEDGSATYKMAESKKKELLKEYQSGIDDMIKDYVAGDDKIESFEDVKYDDDMSKFDIYVNKNYSEMDGLYAMAFYLGGVYYQIIDGKDPEKVDVIVNYIDNESKEVLDTASYQEFIKQGK